MKLTPENIAVPAISAGWAKGSKDLGIAIAVALAESGGETQQISGPNHDGSHDYGLWQINDLAHPDLMKPGVDWSNQFINAQMAHTIWAKSGWNAWSAYKNGSYVLHLLQGQSAANNPSVLSPDRGGVLGETARGAELAASDVVNNDWIKAIVGFFKLFGQAAIWIADPGNWLRVAKVAIGGALVVGGIYVVTRPALEPAIKKSAKLAAVAA
jgi:hypothetical protein